MSALIIDGRAVAAAIRAEQRKHIETLVARHGLRPGLTVILVGADPPSQVYVRNKIAACREVGTHAVRMMASGLFDRFPKLRICLGHMGEAVHFWLWRITFMNSRSQKIGRAPKTKLTMAEYFQRNFVITTSGHEDPLALEYSVKKLGAKSVLWAIDYPYQPTAPAVAFIDAAPLSESDRALVAYQNAERIFHIPPAA